MARSKRTSADSAPQEEPRATIEFAHWQGDWRPGDTAELPESEALGYVNSGAAFLVDGTDAAESAVVESVSTESV